MGLYAYSGYTGEGVAVRGELEAASREEAASVLRARGLVPVRVDPTAGRAEGRSWLKLRRRPSLGDLDTLTSNLALLMGSGVQPDQALEAARRSTPHPVLRDVLADVHRNVRQGKGVAEALSDHPECFDTLYVSIVHIGEATGDLARAFEQLAENLAFRRDLAARTREALAYPIVVVAVCLLSLVFIFSFMVPRFAAIFEGMRDVPVYTRILLGASAAAGRYKFHALAAVAFGVYAVVRVRRGGRARQLWQVVAASVPGLRTLTRTLENLRFSTAMAIQLQSGVHLAEALDHAIRSVENVRVRSTLAGVRRGVREGRSLSESLAAARFFPDLFLGIVEAGEASGKLPEVFGEIRTRLKLSFQSTVNLAVSLLEPAVIVGMGVIVGSIVVVLMLSMVSISDISL